MDQFVSIIQVGVDARSTPTAQSCNATIAVEENASDSESAKIVKYDCLILLYTLVLKALL